MRGPILHSQYRYSVSVSRYIVLSSPSLSIPSASADLNQSVGSTAAAHPPVEVGTKRTRD